MRSIPARPPHLAALVLTALVFALSPAGFGAAQDSQQLIEEKSREIKRLEEEAGQYRLTIDDLERSAGTLQSQIQTRDRTISRLAATIRLTNAKVDRTNLEIKSLERDIEATTVAIAAERDRLRHLVGVLAASEQETPLEIFMKHETLSAFFGSVEQLLDLQEGIQVVLTELRDARAELGGKKGEAEGKRLELGALAEDLSDQKSLQEAERRERSGLLQATKNQERRYQELLAEVERKRDALQLEINALEAGLSPDFDRSILPQTGSGVLGWPLEHIRLESCWGGPAIQAVVNCITQFFGQTSFARAGGYRGKGHNGLDFRAANGTPVFSSEQGRVRTTGNTDAACPRASYGQWILIDHPNHLATLYTHLSLLKVRSGDVVNRGQLIGYSGRTGYATGPHLHFTVFAEKAVAVGQLKSRTCGRTMTLPLSPFGGYLNPLDYL